MSMKDAYIQKLEARMREWQADMDKMRAKADQAEADARADYEKQIKELQTRQEEAQQKLEELRQAGDDAWHDLKAGIESAWDTMGEAMRSAMSRFR